MSRPVSNLRLFVSIEPPAEVGARLISAAGSLGLEGLRVGRAEQLHVTVQFIGDTPSRELEGVAESVRAAASGVPAFELALRGLVVLPERGPARLIGAATDTPAALLELHRRLAHRLAPRARRDAPDRFSPHLTLARFGAPCSMSEPARRSVAGVALSDAGFRVESVRLMRSTLRRSGAEHHEVASISLCV